MGLAMYLGYELYERSQDNEPKEEEPSEVVAPELSLPDEITIVRKDGSSVDIQLLARTAAHIRFKRLSDEASFDFLIDELDEDSQRRVNEYPELPTINFNNMPVEPQTVEDNYTQQLRKAIFRIDEKLHLIELKYAASPSKTERRTLKNNAKGLLEDRKELEAKIAERGGS